MVKKISKEEINKQFSEDSLEESVETEPSMDHEEQEKIDQFVSGDIDENPEVLEDLTNPEDTENMSASGPEGITSQESQVSEELIEYLEERQVLSEKTEGGHLVVIGLSMGALLFCLWTSWKLVTDDSLQVFNCPQARELDAPVAMKRMRDFSQQNVEMYLRGFTRRFIRAMFPKNSTEASYMYKWVANHTEGKLRSEYLGYDDDHVKIGNELDSGRSTDFFPAKASAHKDGVRISSVKGNSGRWVVEVEGFMNDRKSMIQDDRGAVILRLYVFTGDVKLNGSQSGLYVDKIEIISLTDPVSGSEKTIK